MLAIIDGDVLLHRCAWQALSFEEATKNFKQDIINIKESLFDTPTDYVFAFGTKRNWRLDLYPAYKRSKSRSKNRESKQDWFDDLPEWIEARFGNNVAFCDGYEADDLIRIWAGQLDKAGLPYIIVSIDKDLDCIAGKHFDPNNDTIYTSNQDYADKFFFKQLLEGDIIDNIPGVRGIGPKKAEAILSGLETKEEMFKAVAKTYHSKYGEEGYSYMLANARLLHIWKEFDDHAKIDKDAYNAAIKED